ncbi:hypothetical protein LZC95_44790 [Pendulispora brunnea]|uniref:Uncharacterized protein n=1 Tax=Pendulispora brunnea TaxID=2905690 RepID=A0ABZ2K4C8_9BACT
MGNAIRMTIIAALVAGTFGLLIAMAVRSPADTAPEGRDGGHVSHIAR